MIEYPLLIETQEVSNLPNIKSAIKRVKVTATKTLKNNILKSRLKTSIKKCIEAINSDADVKTNLSKAGKEIDKAAAKGILHKNTAARRKSRLAREANKASNQ